MKKFRVLLLMLIILPCCWLFSACSWGEAYVTGIERTSTNGNSEIYTVYYSNGKTTNFTIENGEDGADLEIEEIFSACVARGLYSNDNAGFKEFLSDYLTFEADNTTNVQAINRATLSAVEVYSHFTIPPAYVGASTSEVGCGAGVIYQMNDNYSYIITNYHVVYDDSSVTADGIAGEIKIYQYGVDRIIEKVNGVYQLKGDGVACTYIGGSINNDIAVLKVNTADLLANNENARAVDVADDYALGEKAIAIGNPEGAGISVTEGVVSLMSEYVDLTISKLAGSKYYRLMRVDMAINGGNSGGGIYNEKGELIGILNSKSMYTLDGTVLEGMANAIPIDNAIPVADNIIYHYEDNNANTNGVFKFVIGIKSTGENSRSIYNPLDGSIVIKDDLTITSITTTLASQKFRIGDIIKSITINGTKYSIDREYQLSDYLFNVRIGDDLLFDIVRDDSEEVVSIENVSSAYFVNID